MIHRATPADYEALIAILTEAFTDDPIVTWLFPDPASRAELQATLYYRPLLTHPAAEADLISPDAGAAIWLPLATGQPPYGDQPAPTPRLQELGEALAQRHPHDQPYLYLLSMGVAAAHRGSGLGSAMLRHRRQYADLLGLGTYLEASSPRSRALYLRHGFQDHGTPVQLADGPPLWPMWRPSTPTTGDHQ
ncbi:GNAT family N-acetyltransferase [Kribbella jiaozuonensis]|uniref:GNAT family N-acetyltransferase n=1 Tax=Kribbella jiaozuonensis TaxID=2575441 RepID=A0A4U3LX24_9ACTN|nr:GNAT family N-acetyltransferase [Kribbella jiaozuonensis]TKK80352.1 GNAT family N-acetyltransferase [Kribbella jiaozuonensis]